MTYEEEFHEAAREIVPGLREDAALAMAAVGCAFRTMAISAGNGPIDHRTRRGILDTVLILTFKLPQNPFWQQHATMFGSALTLAALDWSESVTHAAAVARMPEGIDEAKIEARTRAVGLRESWTSLIVLMAMYGNKPGETSDDYAPRLRARFAELARTP